MYSQVFLVAPVLRQVIYKGDLANPPKVPEWLAFERPPTAGRNVSKVLSKG